MMVRDITSVSAIQKAVDKGSCEALLLAFWGKDCVSIMECL